MNFWAQIKQINIRKPQRIFMDYASTTPVDALVQEKMDEYQSTFFANPSALYSEALHAKDFLRESRERVANVLRSQKEEIYFTSGGTEGNNLALLGVFEASKKPDFKPHIVTTNIEHPAILEVCDEIKRRGGEVTLVSVGEDGVVNAKDILNAIKQNTVLVSVMYANNEIGSVQPIKEISKLIRGYREKNNTSYPYFHTDACQAGLYLSLDVLHLGVDLVTCDGIKIYGPRGCGVLYVRNGTKINPIVFGGGQEGGLRSGTEDVASAIGMSYALEIADKEREVESKRLLELRDYAIDSILKNFPKAVLNGSRENRLPNNINICFEGVDAEFAVISLDVLGFAVSYSSSCRTLKEDSSSYVVSALGKKDCSESSLRFTLGKGSAKAQIDKLIFALKKVVI